MVIEMLVILEIIVINSNSEHSSNIIHSIYRNSSIITIIVATFAGRAWELALRMT